MTAPRAVLEMVADVRVSGASGNGVSDDTTAVQAAITRVNAAGGGTVFFPRGTYVVSSLNIPGPNIAFVGAPGSTLDHKAGATLPIFYRAQGLSLISNLLFDGLTLIGNGNDTGTEQTKAGIFVFYSTDVIVRNCTITDFARSAVHLATCLRAKIIDNTLQRCSLIASGDNVVHLDLDPSNKQSVKYGDYVVSGNEITDFNNGGIIIGTSLALDTAIRARAIVTQNIIRAGAAFAGVACEGGFTDGLVISENVIDDCLKGVTLNVPTFGFGAIPHVQNAVVSDNQIDGSGLALSVGINSLASYATITGNTVRTRGNCIATASPGSGGEPSHCVIANNSVVCVNTDGAQTPTCISLNPLNDSVVQGNTLEFTNAGGDTAAGLLYVKNCNRTLIARNTIKNARRCGIFMDTGCNNVTITGNRVWQANFGNLSKSSIQVSAGTDIILEANETIYTAGTGTAHVAGIYVSGTPTRVFLRNNISYGSSGGAFQKDTAGAIVEDRGNKKSTTHIPNGGVFSSTPGAVAVVNIAHGLHAAPTVFAASRSGANSRGAPAFDITADATNIILTFAANLTAATVYDWAWMAFL